MLAVVDEPAEAELPCALADVDHDGIRPWQSPGSRTASAFDLVGSGQVMLGQAIAVVWRVGGQPLCRECVGRCLAHAVPGDSGKELFPAKGEGPQWLLGRDGRCPR